VGDFKAFCFNLKQTDRHHFSLLTNFAKRQKKDSKEKGGHFQTDERTRKRREKEYVRAVPARPLSTACRYIANERQKPRTETLPPSLAHRTGIRDGSILVPSLELSIFCGEPHTAFRGSLGLKHTVSSGSSHSPVTQFDVSDKNVAARPCCPVLAACLVSLYGLLQGASCDRHCYFLQARMQVLHGQADSSLYLLLCDAICDTAQIFPDFYSSDLFL